MHGLLFINPGEGSRLFDLIQVLPSWLFTHWAFTRTRLYTIQSKYELILGRQRIKIGLFVNLRFQIRTFCGGCLGSPVNWAMDRRTVCNWIGANEKSTSIVINHDGNWLPFPLRLWGLLMIRCQFSPFLSRGEARPSLLSSLLTAGAETKTGPNQPWHWYVDQTLTFISL